MQSISFPLESKPARYLLRNVGAYLIYAAVVARSFLMLSDENRQSLFILLLGAYGSLLVGSNTLYRDGRPARLLQAVYLLVQAGIVLAFQPQSFKEDFLAVLFIPLSLQAVLFFGPRLGFAWIALFSALSAMEVMMSWQWKISGLGSVILYIVALAFTGRYAHLILKAEGAHRENRRLAGELNQTCRQLEESSAQAGAYAALQERNRMRRELHDSATQTIFSMNLAAQAAQLLAGKDAGRMGEQLERIQELAGRATAEIQALSNTLRSAAAAEGELPAGLRRLAGERQKRDGLEIQLEIHGERALSAAESAGLYRITQEALNNIAKHASTTQVSIRLHLDRQPACLEISDHGKGFDPAQLSEQSGHMGLRSMAERAREIHWNLTLDSSPGRGTFIRVEEVCA